MEACQRVGQLVRRQAGGIMKHGHKTRRGSSPEYRSWCHAISRCFNPNDKNYSDYGGRGIVVCELWRNRFSAFLQWIGTRPTQGHTLDRWPNKNGNYEPGNVRWATREEQGNNRRSNRMLDYQGEHMNVCQWAIRVGMKRKTLIARLNRGWSVAKSLEVPLREMKGSAA